MTLRFVLRANAVAVPNCEAMALRLQDGHGVRVLDRSPRMLLVAGAAADLSKALLGSAGWSLSPETSTPLPGPKARIKRQVQPD
jgi:hypothetical protein